MLVSDRLKRLFQPGAASWRAPAAWISIKQDNGALLLVSPDGLRMKLMYQADRYVSDAMSEDQYFSLIKKLGREPELWPDLRPRRRK